jgi:hypothetical protein
MGNPHALVDKVVHREGGDAHLCTPRPRISPNYGSGRKEAEDSHVAGLCDKPEDAAVLRIKGPHVRRFGTVRSSKLAGERLLRDLGQIAEAIHTRLSSVSDTHAPSW